MTTTNTTAAPPTDRSTDSSAAWETVIGLEVHAQLRTESKMFCRCPADYAAAAPNTYVCPLCLGMPGTLPVINRIAVEWTIRTALALNMRIPELSKFDRKNYPYPDLMKGYQISQYDMPLSEGGWMDVETDDLGEQRIGITRVHLEEDTARLLHRENEAGERFSLVDVNRSGVPLMEIVSEPDMRSPQQARQYLTQLRQMLRYLGVSTADMEKGSFRCDANVSLRRPGEEALGAKVEIKNMNSFRSVQRALEFEQARQAAALEAGETIAQETRGWDEEAQITVSQRSKEAAHDYRYFPEPDLPPLRTAATAVEVIRAALPELPAARRARFEAEYGLQPFESGLLTEEPAPSEWFEEAVASLGADARGAGDGLPRVIATWFVGELTRLMHDAKPPDTLETIRVQPAQLAGLVRIIDAGTISTTQAKDVFAEMYATGEDAEAVVERLGVSQISGEDALTPIIRQVLEEQAQAAADYRGGKQEALKFLVGQVMRLSRGQANPGQASELLRAALEE